MNEYIQVILQIFKRSFLSESCEKVGKAAIMFSFCVVARYLTEKRRFEQQNPVKIKCSQLNCDQPQNEDLIASLGLLM